MCQLEIAYSTLVVYCIFLTGPKGVGSWRGQQKCNTAHKTSENPHMHRPTKGRVVERAGRAVVHVRNGRINQCVRSPYSAVPVSGPCDCIPMEMSSLKCLLPLLVWLLCGAAKRQEHKADSSSKIVVVYSCNPAWPLLDPLTDIGATAHGQVSRTFEFHNIHSYPAAQALAVLTRADVISWVNYDSTMQLIHTAGFNDSFRTYNSLIPYPQSKTVAMFNNKLAFKTWMQDTGLGSHIGRTYPTADDVKYPCMFKMKELHSGEGVILVHNKSQLEGLVAQHSRSQYFLEEALVGVEGSEFTLFGSSFHGKLLSMRCTIKLNPDHESKYRIIGSTQGGAMNGHASCGWALRGVAEQIVLLSNYTGPFCIDLKADSTGKHKILELNPRFCSTVTSVVKVLLLSSLVPLAFAARDDLLQRERQQGNKKHWNYDGMNSSSPKWYRNKFLKKVNAIELGKVYTENMGEFPDYSKTSLSHKFYSNI